MLKVGMVPICTSHLADGHAWHGMAPICTSHLADMDGHGISGELRQSLEISISQGSVGGVDDAPTVTEVEPSLERRPNHPLPKPFLRLTIVVY